VLVPAFALFFPVQVAITATAVVHLANNVFKVFLVGKQADWGVVLRFALPGAVAALLGAASLNLFANSAPLYTYTLGDRGHEITLVKLIIGFLIILFAIAELLPYVSKLAFERKYLPLGGALSGFFGGLSGNQGALRSAFLIKAGLDKEAFIGTSTVASVIVDVVRLAVYGVYFFTASFEGMTGIWSFVVVASISAFLGAFIGARLITKITLHLVQTIVAIMLFLIGLGMVTGIV
jgi:uncharacterized protein